MAALRPLCMLTCAIVAMFSHHTLSLSIDRCKSKDSRMTGLLREGRRVFNERLKDEYQSKDDALDVQLLDSSVVDAIKGNGGCFVVKKIGDIWLETISKFRGRNQSEDSTKDLDVLGQSVHGLAELFLKCCGDAVTVTNKIRKTIKTLEDSGTDNGHNKVMGETDVWFDLLEEAINAV